MQPFKIGLHTDELAECLEVDESTRERLSSAPRDKTLIFVRRRANQGKALAARLCCAISITTVGMACWKGVGRAELSTLQYGLQKALYLFASMAMTLVDSQRKFIQELRVDVIRISSAPPRVGDQLLVRRGSWAKLEIPSPDQAYAPTDRVLCTCTRVRFGAQRRYRPRAMIEQRQGHRSARPAAQGYSPDNTAC